MNSAYVPRAIGVVLLVLGILLAVGVLPFTPLVVGLMIALVGVAMLP